jgi:thymidine kinase
VICYGLKLNWKAELFEGSKALLELADELVQMDSICKETGNPALFHHKLGGSDAAIETGYEDMYDTVSRKIWKELRNR